MSSILPGRRGSTTPSTDRVGRVAWALLTATVFGGTLTAALLSRPRDIIDVPTIAPEPGMRESVVQLRRRPQPEEATQWTLQLSTDDPAALLEREAIALMVGTNGERIKMHSATLGIAGTQCEYVAETRTLSDHVLLELARQAACSQVSLDGSGVTLNLAIHTDGGSLLLFAFDVPPPGPSAPAPLYVGPPPEPTSPAIGRRAVRGRYIDAAPDSGMRRVDLLNYMWQISERPVWIWIVVSAASVLVVLAIVALPLSDGARPLRTTAAACSLAFALALAYAVIVPPLHAPDEPDHFLGYAAVNVQPGAPTIAGPRVAVDARLQTELEAWGRRGHFMRLRGHWDERLRPSDIGRPLDRTWSPSEVFAEPVGRSPTTTVLWRMVGRLLGGRSAQASLFALRLTNAWLFALAVALGTLVIVQSGGAPYPQMVPLVILLVPTLPFFAMHVSEFAVLASAYVILAMSIAALLMDGPRSHVAGALLGLGTALSLVSGRSAVPLLAAAGAALAGRVVLGTRDRRREWQPPAIFWGGLAAGFAVYAAFANEAFVGETWPIDTRVVPASIRSAAELLRRHIWLVSLLAPVGFAAEWLACRLPLRRSGSVVTRMLAFGGVAAVLAMPLAAWRLGYPQLRLIDQVEAPTLRWYVEQVFGVMATAVRTEQPDGLLSRTLWEGFGWLDTMPGQMLSLALPAVAAFAFVALLIQIGRTSDGRRLTWVLIAGSGLAVALALYAASSFYLLRNLHGRYLLGFYLVCTACAATGLGLTPPLYICKSARVMLVTVAVLGVHIWCLRFLLYRYF